MSYCEALEAAGANVHKYEEFGSYQGDWWALVTYNGEKGWVHGSFGSCSGCDSFQAEFDYSSTDRCDTHRYEYSDGFDPAACADCVQAKADYNRKLAEFGQTYLASVMTQSEAEAEAGRNIEWDGDAPSMLAFIKEQA